MKKYLLSIAALLLGLLAHSQEADDLGNYAEISIIPRLDLNYESKFNLGNSSLYTLFEGSASEHFSWTLANHWFAGADFLGPDANPWSMFKSLGRSDSANWIDLLYVDLNFGGWTFTLGKQAITTGGHEFDAWDWMVHSPMASPLWNGLACYQWGGKVAWTTPSEMTSLSLQMTTSPFGERPFASGLYTFSFQWSGEYAWFLPLWSVSAFAAAPGQYRWLVSLGNQFRFGDWTLGVDWNNIAGFTGEYDDFLPGNIFHGSLAYTPSERWNFSLLGNLVTFKNRYTLEALSPAWNVGGLAEFYPLTDSQDLRLHAMIYYLSEIKSVSFSIGAVYNLTFKLW